MPIAVKRKVKAPIGNAKVNQKTKLDKNEDLSPRDKLTEFLASRVVKTKADGQEQEHTHISLDAPFAKYVINPDFEAQFLKLYADAINDGSTLSIAECHKDVGPIVMDFNFIQPGTAPNRKYTDITIKNVVKLFNGVMRTYLEIDEDRNIAYVSEKPSPELRDGEYHDGFHVMYPHICTTPMLQLLMRNDLIQLLNKRDIFKNIPCKNALRKIITEDIVYQKPWLLYGSAKTADSKPYLLTTILQATETGLEVTTFNDMNFEDPTYIETFTKMTSIRKFSNNQMTPYAESVDPKEVEQKATAMKIKLAQRIGDGENIANLLGNNTSFVKAASDIEYEEAQKLIKLLSKDRAKDPHSVMEVGKCLHNIDYRLCQEWIEFRRRANNDLSDEVCADEWRKMANNHYTNASLHFWARTDNVDSYNALRKECIDKLLKDALVGGHAGIANLFIEKYKFRFKCGSIKNKEWFEFKNHKWVQIPTGYTLRNLISDELTRMYASLQQQMYHDAGQKNGYDKDQALTDAGRVSKLINKLNDSNFKEGIMKACADKLFDPEFYDKLDEQQYLICFKNGVYDLEADVFREGCPDDCVSLCTGYNYVEYNPNDKTAKDINDFLCKIQPDKEIREYLLTVLSTCLCGSISTESFYVFTGSGANGKSKLMELMKYTLGKYFKPMDVKILTAKRGSSSAASPELADKKGIRLCPLDEPEAGDEIHTGFMKLMTGGDEIMARALFKDPIYFKPQFKPFLLCNNLPKIRADDDGTWRRLKVIQFGAKFVDPAIASEKQLKQGLKKGQHWADRTLSTKLKNWNSTFVGLLLVHFRKYYQDTMEGGPGFRHPKAVTQATNDYRRTCDLYQDFIADYLTKTEDEKDIVTVNSMHQGLRAWFKNNYPGTCPNKKELKEYLLQRLAQFYVKNGEYLKSYKIKDTSDPDIDKLAAYEGNVGDEAGDEVAEQVDAEQEGFDPDDDNEGGDEGEGEAEQDDNYGHDDADEDNGDDYDENGDEDDVIDV
jgi:P4 family phage/plasmid primase-like protien